MCHGRGNVTFFPPNDEEGEEAMDLDVDGDAHSDTSDRSVLTDVMDPVDYDNDDEQDTQDSSDLAELLADNEHPPEYYINLLSSSDESLKKNASYAPNSLKLLDRIEKEWFKFCTYVHADPKELYRQINLNLNTLNSFFEWVLNQSRGQDGRHRSGLKHKSSLETYWKIFRLVYEREMIEKISKEISRCVMRNVIPTLAAKHKLSNKGRPKSVAYLDDLVRIVETTITTTKKKFGHGRQRVSLCLYFQLAGFSANRPTALLKLCYRHIKVTLLKDPEGGPNNILIEFTVEFAKQFLGEKEETTFIIPEIIFDPSLVLSPHVILLGLLFGDGAFARLDGERILTSAEQLLYLEIPEGVYQLELHLDPRLDDVPLLRKTERKFDRITISDTEGLTYATLSPWIKRIGVLAMLRKILRAYSLRQGAGKALDNSGHVSEAVRSLIFQHSDPKTFLKYYLHRKVDKDVRAIVQGLDPQEHIIRAACRMLRTVNPRRPQELTTAQSSSVNQQPHIEDLIRRRDLVSRRLKRPIKDNEGPRYRLYKELETKLGRARRKARDRLLLEIQEKFDFEEPLREVKRQLSGAKLSQDVESNIGKSLSIAEVVPPEQRRLISALLTLPRKTLKEEMLRRTEAIDAVAAYCLFEEGDTCRLPQNKRPVTRSAPKEETVGPPPLSEKDTAINAVMQDYRPLYCFICLKGFSNHGGVSKHLRRSHLQYIKPGDHLTCPRCEVVLENMMAVQNHAHMIHKTVT